MHYVAATEAAVATCEPCGETLGPTIAWAVAGAASISAVALLLYAVYSHLPDPRKKQLQHTWRIFHLGVKLKVSVDASNAVAATIL